MDWVQLATLAFTGVLTLERSLKHCGGVRHLDLRCSKCMDLSLSRTTSGASSPLGSSGVSQSRGANDEHMRASVIEPPIPMDKM